MNSTAQSPASEINVCPACGAEVPAGAPHQLCPKCLLAGVAETMKDDPSGTGNPPLPNLETIAGLFPQLEILELIGRGGMGVVFKARHLKLDRLVALKILPAHLAEQPGFRERFEREARALARLSHPAIVAVHDFGEARSADTSESLFYLVMEFVDGVNLRQAMQIGGFTGEQALLIVPKICEALAYAHAEGVLHRDIKPENILLDTKGRVKIADFGIAKVVGDATAPPHGLTETGAALGTPHYMAPEQFERPAEVDHRADIYSLGVVFYEMLTGELPLGRFAPPSRKSEIDPRIDEVVLRALEKQREHRQQSAQEIKSQVETISGTHPKNKVSSTSITRLSRGALVSFSIGVVVWSVVISSVFVFLDEVRTPWKLMILLQIIGCAAGVIATLVGVQALESIRGSKGKLIGSAFAAFGAASSAAVLLPSALAAALFLLFGKLNGAASIFVGLVAGFAFVLWFAHTLYTYGRGNASGRRPRVLALSAGAVAAVGILCFAITAIMMPAHIWSGAAYNERVQQKEMPRGELVGPGVLADVIVPPGQVAMIEIVTKEGDKVVPLPQYSAYFGSYGSKPYTVRYRWGLDPTDVKAYGPRTWSVSLETADGKLGSSGGLHLPEHLAPSVGGVSGTYAVVPNNEVVNWFHSDFERQAPLGLRIRTEAHGLQSGSTGNFSGIGHTDWRKNNKWK